MTDAGASRAAVGARRLGIAVLCVLLFLFFCVVRFPFASFRAPIQSALGAALGGEVTLGTFEGGPSLGVLGVRAERVRVVRDGRALDFESVRARPAWSPSWLLGQPALHVDIRSPMGRVAGTVWPDASAPGFDGRLEDVALDALGSLVPGAAEMALQGRLGGDLELYGGPAGLRGALSVEAVQGALSPPGLPVAVPFETLRAEATFDPESGVALEELALDGPLVSGTVTGTIGAGPATRAPLDLELVLTRLDPGIQAMATRMGAQGVQLGQPLRVQGTLEAPLVR